MNKQTINKPKYFGSFSSHFTMLCLKIFIFIEQTEELKCTLVCDKDVVETYFANSFGKLTSVCDFLSVDMIS